MAVATGVYGVSFGALGVGAGLSVWQTQVLSLLMFTGGSQFAFVGAIAGGGAGALVASSLLGIRNALYGARLSTQLPVTGWRRPLAAHLTVDESFAVAVAQRDPDEVRRGFWVTGFGIYAFWNASTLLGALLGDIMGDPRTWGLDGAAVAAFLGLLWPRLSVQGGPAIALIGAGVATVCLPLLPQGIPLLVVAGVVAIVATVRKRP